MIKQGMNCPYPHVATGLKVILEVGQLDYFTIGPIPMEDSSDVEVVTPKASFRPPVSWHSYCITDITVTLEHCEHSTF